MGDLVTAVAYTCVQNEAWSTTVHGKTGIYTVRWAFQFNSDVQYAYECTCPAYKFSKEKRHCKHIDQVCGKRCVWNAALDPGMEPWMRPATEWETEMMIASGEGDVSRRGLMNVKCCPDCKGPVKAVTVGV